MNYLEANRSQSPCLGSCSSEWIKPRCIEAALIVIALTGAALVVSACVSYLPPIAGYVGGGFSICSLIALAIGHCCVEKPIHYAAPLIPQVAYDSYSKTFQPAHVTSSNLVIPDEIYLQIFQYLEGQDLAVASRVCHQWLRVANDQQLWERLCYQARICPPEDTVTAPSSYRNLYGESQIWKKRMAQGIPPERHISIPIQSGEVLCSICKIENYFFIHCRRSTYDQFEIWDASLSRLLCKTALIHSERFLSDVRFKKIGEVGYLFGWARKWSNQAGIDFFLCDIHVLRLDLKTLQPLPYMYFPQKHRAHSHFKPPFDITQNQAYLGLEDGSIVIWDLACIQPSHDSSMDFDDDSTWSNRSEEIWQASYKTEISPPLPYYLQPPQGLSYIEKGEYARSLLQGSRDYHLMLQNRIRLQGHTQATMTLHVVGNNLFSSSRDGTIKQWDLTTHQCLRTIQTGRDSGVSLFNVAGRYLFGLTDENYLSTLSQWDLTTGTCLFNQSFEKKYQTFHVVGNLIFFASTFNTTKSIDIYDLSTQTHLQPLSVLRWHPFRNEYVFQIVNHTLYAANEDHFLVWDYDRASANAINS